MKYKIKPIYFVWFTILGLSLVVSACARGTSQPAKPIANITAPENASSFSVGQEVDITFSAADVKGVSQVELSIDGQPLRIQTVDPPVNSFVGSQSWTPETAGSHSVELRAFNVDGDVSDSVQITVIINAPVAEAVPTETPTSEPSPTVISIPPTPTSALPSPTATAESVEEPTSESTPMVTTLVGLNVRAGPGTNYPVVGRLAAGETVEIVGRNELSTWWQIPFSSNIGDRAWISAGDQYSTASNTAGVPVADIPAPPAAPAPTETPVQLKPSIFSFTADRYTITPGETVVLNWDLANAQSAFLRYNDTEEGVVAPGNKRVSPVGDTVYTLIARNEAGETRAEVTIKVSGSPPTPAPVYKDGRTAIVSGQSIDFDQGVVQVGTTGDADFLWDGQQKRFLPQGSATGTLLGSSYDQINLGTCLAADYGRPIPDISTSTTITGCYKTNQGRYGKFFVTDWDLAGNLTINWQTWNYR
ncbi:MAG: SH3 domain-containing protein [Anaerolineae bacterium]|nr:SH3 domain-containing protein [Anaerolineae bacterium]